MAKFIGVNTIGYDQVQNMFNLELNSFRYVPYLELKVAMNNKTIVWLQHVNELPQAITLHSLGLTNKEIFIALYDTPPLIPQ